MRVLLVQQNPVAAEALRNVLVGHRHTVSVVRDATSGCWAATDDEYDVLVLDLRLPGRSGHSLVRELREREVWTPVLAISDQRNAREEAAVLDVGADDYLARPFPPAVLLARLRALQRRGSPTRPVELRVGDLVLDPACYRVFRADEEIRLTPREFGVLEYLMRHAGEPVAKTDLLAAVWDEHYDGDVNPVELVISYLRRKVDAPFGCVSIETVRGRGYRLVDDPAMTRAK